jgi:archaellum biogenesis ATPase FlaH
MVSKTLTGVSFFDERYGGIYRGRTMLVTGRASSGKSVLALQFILQGLQQSERCILLSERPMADLIIFAESLKMSLSQAIELEDLILLEYHDYIPGGEGGKDITLPPDGFLQFKEIIETHAVQRIVLDTILPWVSIRPQANLAEHVFSFVRAFERLGVTTLMTIPKPASLPSIRLKNTLEVVIPISVSLAATPNLDDHTWITTKYLGEMKLDSGIPYQITPGIGITSASPTADQVAGPNPVTQTILQNSSYAANHSANHTANGADRPKQPPQKIQFSNVIKRQVAAEFVR